METAPLTSREQLYVGFTIACSCILLVLFLIHSTKIYQDLFTAERKSVDHRVSKPVINRTYKARVYCIAISIFGNIVYFGFYYPMLTVISPSAFMLFWIGNGLSFAIARTSQYATFMLRLHHTYKDTDFAYPTWLLKSIVGWGWVGTVSIPFFVFLHALPGKPERSATLEVSSDDIVITFPPQYVGLYMLTELGIQFAVLLLFKIPLNKTIKQVEAYHAESSSVRHKVAKMSFVESKIFVLAATAAASTLLAFVIYFGTLFEPIWYIDAVTNSICLLLMSPYYTGPKGNDELLYRTLCKPMIVCCCQVKYSLVYHERKKDGKGQRTLTMSGIDAEPEKTVKTVDTESAPRIYAEEEAEEMAAVRAQRVAAKHAHLAATSASMTPPPNQSMDIDREPEPAMTPPPTNRGNPPMENVHSDSGGLSEYNPTDDAAPQERVGDYIMAGNSEIELQVQGPKVTAVDTPSEPTAVNDTASGRAGGMTETESYVEPQKENLIDRTSTDLMTPSRD